MRTRVTEGFRGCYRRDPAAVSRAPGRLEMLGNHTDYNEGVVLSVAVDRATWVGIAPGATDACRLTDLRNGERRSFSCDALDNPEPGDWANYVKGVVVELLGRGFTVPAFDAAFVSTVPISAGMSSSAALEISMAYAIGHLAGIELSPVEWARVGQGAENNYVGARTGLLDQFSSIMGKRDHLVFSDFRTLEVERVPLPQGTALVVANSMVQHQLTNEYNERRERCEEAVSIISRGRPEVKALRDVTREQLERVREQLPVVTWRRAMHVAGENERVFAGRQALARDDVAAFGAMMLESHESSRVFFENSCPELDVLVDIGASLPGCLGARLSGGGFGGISVHLVEADQAETYARRLETAYFSRTGIEAEIMVCSTDQGAELAVC